MTFLHQHGWRIALVASGVIAAAGGPMHPSSDAEDPIRDELATMTADPSWVPGHSLIVVSTVVLAFLFYAVFTPCALIMRLAGRDALRLRKRDAPSHWVPYEQKDDPADAFRQY